MVMYFVLVLFTSAAGQNIFCIFSFDLTSSKLWEIFIFSPKFHIFRQSTYGEIQKNRTFELCKKESSRQLYYRRLFSYSISIPANLISVSKFPSKRLCENLPNAYIMQVKLKTIHKILDNWCQTLTFSKYTYKSPLYNLSSRVEIYQRCIILINRLFYSHPISHSTEMLWIWYINVYHKQFIMPVMRMAFSTHEPGSLTPEITRK